MEGVSMQDFIFRSKSVYGVFFSEITHTFPQKSNGPRPLNSCLLGYQFDILKPSIKWNAQYLKELT